MNSRAWLRFALAKVMDFFTRALSVNAFINELDTTLIAMVTTRKVIKKGPFQKKKASSGKQSHTSTRKLKIAVMHPFFIEKGGAERKALLIAQGLRKLGYEQTIFTFKVDKEKCFPEWMDGLKFVELPYGKTFSGKFSALKAMGKAAKGFDVIHCHNFPANIAASYAKKYYGTPVVYYCNEPFLYEQGTVKKMSWPLLHLERLAEKYLTNNIDLIVGNSKYTTERISKIFGKKAIVRYSGIYTDKFVPLEKKSKHPIVFAQNRLMPEKRIDTLLPIMEKVWKKFPEAELRIGGDGPERERLAKLFAGKNAKVLGPLSFEDLIKNYQQADVFAFTARNEPLGITPVEAMSCGTPAVAHNSGGPRETIIDGVTGYLVNDDDAFAERIIKILSLDKTEYKKMSAAARERVLKDFSVEAQTQGAIACYELVLNR